MCRVIPKPGKVGFDIGCAIPENMTPRSFEGTWPELPSYCYGFQRARRREGVVASHLALAARFRHEGISFVDESLDMANAFGSLDRRKLKM